MIRAVIFDMDGTLLDTERLMIEAGLAAMRTVGLPERRDVLVSLVGSITADSEAILARAFGPGADLDRLDAHWSAEAEAAYARGIPLRPGAAELLDHLATAGLPVALATNSRTAHARETLARAGLASHFPDAVVHGRDLVARPKPAPDVFLAAARTLAVAPGHCLVFEDSDPGVIGAVAAGMRVVHVPDQRPPGTDAAHHLAGSLLDGARAAGLIG